MNTLFLALSGTRRGATISEAVDVVRAGGTAVILIGDRHTWRRETFPEGVGVVELPRLQRDHLPLRIERLVLFRAPKAGFTLIGRGPLRRFGRRAAGAYERRFANKVHRRVLPLYQRIWKNRERDVILSKVVDPGEFDTIAVTDFASLSYAASLVRALDAAKGAVPRLCYSIDHLSG